MLESQQQQVLLLLKEAVVDAERLSECSPDALVSKLESILDLLRESDLVVPITVGRLFLHDPTHQ